MDDLIEGIICIVIFGFIGHWTYQHFHRTDVPWWAGTENQKVCVVHNPNNSNCYYLPVTVSDKKIIEIGFPNGGFASTSNMECGKAVTFKGRYCVVTDTQERDWEIKSN